MFIISYMLTVLCAYLIGSSNMALYISKLRGIDMRSGGSGNLGTSNAMLMLGWKAGILVGIHDIGKGLIAVLLARYVFPQLPYIGAVAGVAAVFGHIYPFYLHFKGGKGLACYIGMTIALNWRLALAVCIAIVVLTLITGYIVTGTVTTVISVPISMGVMTHSLALTLILCAATAVILYKHRENYIRIYNGTEINLAELIQGKYRHKR